MVRAQAIVDLDAGDVGRAERLRGQLFARTAAFFDDHDVLLTCTSQVPPFPIEQEWVDEIDGVRLDGYIAWMRSCSRVTVTGCPALSLPAAFTTEGLPVGVQLVGPYRQERRLLAIGAAFEAMLGAGNRLLNDPDTYWHIAAGRWIFAHREIPAGDPFSFTFQGAPWVAHEWLAELLFALAWRAGGWPDWSTAGLAFWQPARVVSESASKPASSGVERRITRTPLR